MPTPRMFFLFCKITPKLQNKGPKKGKNRKSPESDPCTWGASGGLIMPSVVVPTPQEPHFCIILLFFCKISPKLQNKGPKHTKKGRSCCCWLLPPSSGGQALLLPPEEEEEEAATVDGIIFALIGALILRIFVKNCSFRGPQGVGTTPEGIIKHH